MSDTPETDAMVEESFHRINFPTAPVPAEFARKLELERDQLKQLLAADSERVDAYLGVCIERDEARFLLKAAQSALNVIHLEIGGWIKIMKENTD